MTSLPRLPIGRWRTAPVAVALLLQPCGAAVASPILESEFIDPAPPYPQAHASTIVELGDGTLAAAWFGGRRATGESISATPIIERGSNMSSSIRPS
jgi:predicted neuraminidase